MYAKPKKTSVQFIKSNVGVLTKIKNEFNRVPYLYLLPPLILFSVFIILPVFQSFYYSFFDYDGLGKMNFIALDNYKKLFRERLFSKVVWNTTLFTLLNVVIQAAVALPLAVILNGDIRQKNFFRAVFFLPTVLSVVVIGYVFQFIFNPVFGTLNEFLRYAGLEMLTRNWLGDTKIVLYSIIFVTCWQGIGYATIIYLGGLQTIPTELYEASDIDGASPFSKFIHITFPMLAPIFNMSILISIIANIKEFGRIYVMTQGGPNNASEVFVTFLYKGFNDGYYGYGSAVAVILFLVLMVFSILHTQLSEKRENF